MGNRAVITCSTSQTSGIGIYLHWNGGLESVLAFLKACEVRGFRTPSDDETYAMGRLCGLIHEFFGTWTDTSLGIGTLKELDTDNGDNGVYVIGPGWEIAKRWGSGSDPRKTLKEIVGERYREQYEEMVAALTKPLPKED